MRSALPLAALAGLVALAACTDKAATTGTGTGNTTASISARAYIDTAIAFEDQVFLPTYHSRVNFLTDSNAAVDSLRRTASQGPGRDTLYFGPVEYTIDPFLRNVGDQHSDYFPPSEAPGTSDANPSDPTVNLNGFMLGGNAGVRASSPVAYLWYPSYDGTNDQGHIDSTQTLVRSLDQNNPCGYVLDLRYNYGGSIYPMVAGLTPLLGNAVVTSAQGGIAGWGPDYQGAIYRLFSLNGEVGVSVNLLNPADSVRYNSPPVRATNPYTLGRPNTPVAILTDTVTASAAEFITLSFRGGAVPFRTFGTGTFGVTTTPYNHQFADTGFLNIAAAVMIDRNGNAYGGSLRPDQRVTDNRFIGFTSAGRYYNKVTPAQVSATPDSMVQAAVAWLNTQASCGGTQTAVHAPNYARDASGVVPAGAGARLRRPGPVSRLWMTRRAPVSRKPLYFRRKR